MLPGILVCFLLFESTFAMISDNFNACREFFYKNAPPQLTHRGLVETNKCICQNYKDWNHFASFYDTVLKVPLYSAYKVTIYQKPKDSNSKRTWRKDDDLKPNEQPLIGDYDGVEDSHLNRGHLATRFYFPTNEGRNAADALTNIALQYKIFNRLTWYRLEKALYDASKDHCNEFEGVSYFITGVYPNDQPFKKLYIPNNFWTAVCCDTSNAIKDENKFKGWSFAYIVPNKNTAIQNIQMFTVDDFLKERGIRNNYHKLFQDITFIERGETKVVKNCLFDSNKAYEMMNSFVIKVPNDHFFLPRDMPDLLKKREPER